jgi:hypothetical protein
LLLLFEVTLLQFLSIISQKYRIAVSNSNILLGILMLYSTFENLGCDVAGTAVK